MQIQETPYELFWDIKTRYCLIIKYLAHQSPEAASAGLTSAILLSELLNTKTKGERRMYLSRLTGKLENLQKIIDKGKNPSRIQGQIEELLTRGDEFFLLN